MPNPSRNAEPEYNPRSRFVLWRLCDCTSCSGKGKREYPLDERKPVLISERCPDCRGEGRIRQEVASCESPEAVGVALVTLGREKEWEGCAFGCLDRMPECETCRGSGIMGEWNEGPSGKRERTFCPTCKGSGVKPTGTWIISPWLPSPRNVTDAARTLARSKRTSQPS